MKRGTAGGGLFTLGKVAEEMKRKKEEVGDGVCLILKGKNG